MFKDRKPLYYLGLFVVCLLFYKIVDNLGDVMSALLTFLSMLTPFFIAFFIAYLLRPIVNVLENKVFHRHRFKRVFSIAIVYAILIGMIVLSFTVISPRVVDSVTSLIHSLPGYIASSDAWLRANVLEQEWFIRSGIGTDIADMFNTFSSKFGALVQSKLSALVSGIVTVTSTLFNLIVGLIVSVYLLKDKEKFAAGSQKLLLAVFKQKRANAIVEYTKSVDRVFSQYFVGLILDAIVIGTIVFIGLLILKSPYALLSSLIVAITNVIPYFGPFVGMLSVGIMMLMIAPVKALWVTLFIFAVQQLDGYYIGPKIMGNKVGVGPLWIILAVMIGGGLFGVIGMFVAVPIIAVIMTTIDSYAERRIASHEKNDVA